ncbi:uncharacterized protein MELLADRAFT_123821 [Melampsora larici-populina 98AG31]|uniref:Secreted protein n=1 Tax=Melampsora larici-populina (strain 98AG31 / pathotype 3-4-7) TaxID=747676 RepID=F4RAV7_MELLP|nr:uncharacterized protein MELLADRAFT_123821 [Melampsora larici-populina 98AG31]EGG10710.1 secreted protein [Melampsora larici-populina 98AG31]
MQSRATAPYTAHQESFTYHHRLSQIRGRCTLCALKKSGFVLCKPGPRATSLICQPGTHTLAQQNCHNRGCYHKGDKWVELGGCILEGTTSGETTQRCARYHWLDEGGYGCYNHGGRHYVCKGTPDKIPYITCTQCFTDT